MKAEHVRSLLKWYCETRFDINSKYAYEQLEELERIATEYEANKHYIELGKAVDKKVQLFDSLIDFIDKEYLESNSFHYSDGGNQYRQGYKSCLEKILKVVDEGLLEWAEGRE